MAELLETLIIASERAACIARSCCQGGKNETLLVAEKCEEEANTRFDRDFKTIADVLAQESARSEILSRYPELAENFRGEECAEIGGVRIKLQETVEQTTDLLIELVPPGVATRMSEAAHCEISFPPCENIPTKLPTLNLADLGIWIDPIDATAEFIAGVRGEADAERGLPCVTVLIGAYELSTGMPVIGVINQPFYNKGKGRVIWGLSCGDTQIWSGSDTKASESKTVLMSGAEKPEIAVNFKVSGWKPESVPGAGHKLMKVILGEAAAYFVSKGTTFRWDTCGPHAILRAQGGDLLCYKTLQPITYNDPMDGDTQQYANSGGIIAYSDADVFSKIKEVFT